jgi:hypothetical protein
VRGDEIGFYFDQSAADNCSDDLGLHQCYAILNGITDPIGVDGYAFSLTSSPGIFLIEGNYPNPIINLETFPVFYVGCSSPIPPATFVELFSFSAFAANPGSLFLEGVYSYSPHYVGASSGDLIPLSCRYGGSSSPVLSLGGADCPELNADYGVENINSTLDDIKCIYRERN